MPLYLSCGIENNKNLIDDINYLYKRNISTQYHILLDRINVNNGYKNIRNQFNKISGNIVQLPITNFTSFDNIDVDNSLFLVYCNGKIPFDFINRFELRNILKTLIQKSEKSKLIFIAFNDVVSIVPELSRNLLFSITAQMISGSNALQKIKKEHFKPFNRINYLLTNNSFIKFSNRNLYYRGNVFRCKQKQWHQYKQGRFVDI